MTIIMMCMCSRSLKVQLWFSLQFQIWECFDVCLHESEVIEKESLEWASVIQNVIDVMDACQNLILFWSLRGLWNLHSVTERGELCDGLSLTAAN